LDKKAAHERRRGISLSVRIAMRVSLKDIREAFECVSAGDGDEHQAFLCKQSGKGLLSLRAL
jgi:hypothetical protein